MRTEGEREDVGGCGEDYGVEVEFQGYCWDKCDAVMGRVEKRRVYLKYTINK